MFRGSRGLEMRRVRVLGARGRGRRHELRAASPETPPSPVAAWETPDRT